MLQPRYAIRPRIGRSVRLETLCLVDIRAQDLHASEEIDSPHIPFSSFQDCTWSSGYTTGQPIFCSSGYTCDVTFQWATPPASPTPMWVSYGLLMGNTNYTKNREVSFNQANGTISWNPAEKFFPGQGENKEMIVSGWMYVYASPTNVNTIVKVCIFRHGLTNDQVTILQDRSIIIALSVVLGLLAVALVVFVLLFIFARRKLSAMGYSSINAQ